jgi:TPR repeat protein
LWLFVISSIGGIARAADDAAFDLVLPDRYNAMLRDGGRAYDRKDYAQAFELNRRTACAGDKTSQAIVGRMYVLGQGTPRDELTGYGWIKLAAEFGFAEYTSLAHKLEGAMTPERRAQASARAEAMHKNYGLVATGMSCHGESRHGVYIIDAVVCTPPSDGGMVRLHRCLDAGVN